MSPDLTRSDMPDEIEGIAHVARNQSATGRQPQDPCDQASTLVGLISRETTREIDRLIDDLIKLRNKLQDASNRIQTDIAQFGSLNAEAVQLTRVVSDSFVHVQKASDAPSISTEITEFNDADA